MAWCFTALENTHRLGRKNFGCSCRGRRDLCITMSNHLVTPGYHIIPSHLVPQPIFVPFITVFHIHFGPHDSSLRKPLPLSSTSFLIKPLGRIIFRTDRQPLPLTRRFIRDLHNIHQLLLILNCKVDLVIIARAEIDLDVLVAPEKHDCAWVVDFVHGVEVGNGFVVDGIDDGEISNERGEFGEVFVLGGGLVGEWKESVRVMMKMY
jgi:hypothetical protein